MQRLLILLCCIPLGILRAYADGGFIPEATFPMPESIPDQTALIVFESGRETLVVESTAEFNTAQTTRSRLAWVVPLPAKPDVIEAMPAGFLKTLRFCVGPKIVGPSVNPAIFLFCFILCFTVPRALWMAIKIRNGQWGSIRKGVIAFYSNFGVIVGIILALTMIAVAEDSPTHSMAAGQAREWKRVGNYSSVVLTPNHLSEMESWLRQEGFAELPEIGRNVLGDYIAEDWCLLVSKLEMNGGKFLTPHPIKVVFASPEPVYPMRLTALGGGTTEVCLYLAVEERMKGPKMQTLFADQFKKPVYLDNLTTPGMASAKFDAPIGYPPLIDLIPDGFWVSCVQKNFSPQEMKADVKFSPSPTQKPIRKEIFTKQKAVTFNLFWGALTINMLMPLWGWICHQRKNMNRFFWLLPLVIVAGFLLNANLIETVRARTSHEFRPGRRAIEKLSETVKRVVGITGPLPSDAPERLRAEVLLDSINPFSGEAMIEEASPGNFVVKKDVAGVPYLEFYDVHGTPIDIKAGRPRI